MPAFAQRMTTTQSLGRQPYAACVAVDFNGFHRIGRATGIKAAVLAKQGADEAFVALQQEDQR